MRYRTPMRTKHIFVTGAALELRVRVRASKTGLNPSVMFPTDLSNKVPLLHFFFVCASVVSYYAA